jgi:rubrerythrin
VAIAVVGKQTLATENFVDAGPAPTDNIRFVALMLQIEAGEISMAKEYCGVRCRCGEELTASAWSEHVNVQEVRNFWCCPNCGYMFESVDPFDDAPLPIELAEKFLSNLVIE